MEKRLFIAVALSFLVLFLFQPKAVKDNKNQPVDNKTVAVVDKKQAEPQVSPSPHSPLSAEDPRDRVEVEANGRKIVFSRRGGSISSLRLDAYDHDLVVGEIAGLPELDGRVFDLKTVSLTEYWMQSLGDDLEVVKKYDLSDPLNIRIEIEISNKKSEPVLVGRTQNFLEIDASSLDKNQNKSDWTLFEYAIKTEKKIFRKNNAHSFSDKWNKEWSSSTRWIGFRDRYFAVIVAPQKDSQKAFSKYIDEKRLVLGGEADAIEILPGQKGSLVFVVYAGPQDPKSLKAAGEGFEEIMVFSDWGWLDAIAKAIYWLLFFCHNILQSWGLCIVFVSLFVYSCLYPLTMKSLVSMRKMQTLQPKIAEIKKVHEKDPQKMNQAVMDLYRREGVNPLGGCLPMVLQMPIFIGLYQVLWRSFYLRGEGFLWINDLSMPDKIFKLPVTIPFLGEYFNLLPILMVAIMAVQQALNMKNMVVSDDEQKAQQKIMAVFFPIFLGFIFYNFSSGLNLYFVVFYLLSTFTQWKVSKKVAG